MWGGAVGRRLLLVAHRELPAARSSQTIPAGFVDPALPAREMIGQKFAVTSA